jgi:hypothetical protein
VCADGTFLQNAPQSREQRTCARAFYLDTIWSAELNWRTAADWRTFSIRHGGAAPSIAAVAANLFLVSASRQVADPHSGPAQICHYLCKMPVGARCSAALGNIQYVQQGLAAHSFQPVIIYFAAHPFQRQPPRIDVP